MSVKFKVLSGKLTLTSKKPCDLRNCTKQQIKEYFENSYDLNESLFSAIKDASTFHKCPDRLRLPMIFYYGHTACVYINKLILAGLIQPEQRVNIEFETMFETGVDEMSWDDTENYRMGGKFDWPSVEEVVAYRVVVRKLILDTIDKTPLQLPVDMESPWWGMFMAMEHERIHLETSSVLIRQLPVDTVRKPPGWTYAPAQHVQSAGKNALIRLKETDVTLGKPKDFPSFGWDNEYGIRQARVPAFEASRYLVSNKEFLAFVRDGSYQKPQYWTEEGWQWVQFKQAKHPLFWVCESGCKSGCGADLATYSHCKPQQRIMNGQNSNCNGHSQVDSNGHQGKDEGGGQKQRDQHKYRFRCMFDVIEMPWDWPVETNYHEAKAFCSWKGPDYRLLCEAEHNVIQSLESPVGTGTKSDLIYQDDIQANLNMKYGSSTPVNMFPPNPLGFYDTFGNVWAWVEDHFNGLPGFKTSYVYDDFSMPTFDGRHNVLQGGSWVSTGDSASRFARYAFRRHFFQHCGFRIARSINADEEAALPVAIIKSPVFPLGAGIKEHALTLEEKHGFVSTETANSYAHYDGYNFLNESLCFEYSSPQTYPVILAQRCKELVEKYNSPRRNALHLGCSTGRCTFGLGKVFHKVFAVDYSEQFIDACNQLNEGKNLRYTTFDGFKKSCKEVTVTKDVQRDVSFKQLSWLPNEVQFFDFILASSFDRIVNVRAWTARLFEVLRKQGMLVVASCGDWDEEALAPLLAHKFDLKEVSDLEYKDNGSKKTARVSVWLHKPTACHIPFRDGPITV